MAMLPVTSAAQLAPEQVPSLEERTQAVAACLEGVLPRGIISLIAKQAMERFDGEIFGPQQWIGCWGATPVTLHSAENLRDRVLQVVRSEGRQLDKEVEEMSAAECANFLGLQGEEEHLEPPEELYECLNRRVRPEDRLLAGFSCVATYIPQYVRKDHRILCVTVRTLALDLGPHPVQGEVAKLADPAVPFESVLTPEDADRTEASCYFVMERDVAPNTKGGKRPKNLMAQIKAQGDKGWQFPEPRNFFATVFSRRAWKGEFLYGGTFTYGQGKSRTDDSVTFGNFSDMGLYVFYARLSYDDRGLNRGASGSRKFTPKLNPS